MTCDLRLRITCLTDKDPWFCQICSFDSMEIIYAIDLVNQNPFYFQERDICTSHAVDFQFFQCNACCFCHHRKPKFHNILKVLNSQIVLLVIM